MPTSKIDDAPLAFPSQRNETKRSRLYRRITSWLAGIIWIRVTLWLSETTSSVLTPPIVRWVEG